MIFKMMILLARFLLWLRYRVRVRGLDKILRTGKAGILFLPNHPALIDPIILMTRLYGPFKARALADSRQIDRFLIRWFAKGLNVLAIQNMSGLAGSDSDQVHKVIGRCVAALQAGDNLVLYPAGRTYRQKTEDLRGTSAVERILGEAPSARVVLVRTRGLWGSSFSRASGSEPSIGDVLRRGLGWLLLNGVFFGPRREVTIELVEPSDMPTQADRMTINRYLEKFYNEDALPNTYVRRTIWERGDPSRVPEPVREYLPGQLESVPPATRQIVTEFLGELTGCMDFDDSSRLAHELGMDSLTAVELATFLQSEFGFAQSNIESLQTVGDVMLASCGQSSASARPTLKKIPRKWFSLAPTPDRPEGLDMMTVGQAFLTQARRWPDKAIIADQTSGVKTYRDIVVAVLLLKEKIRKLPGERVGIMMPASVGADILYLATLFASKTPAMINWTLGRKNLLHCLAASGVERILTSGTVVSRIRSQGLDLSGLQEKFVCIEDIVARLGVWEKFKAFVASRCCWSALRRAANDMSATATVLFTSGSESVPKAVPLTHRNMLTNVHDAYDCFEVSNQDVFVGILPPFHSFGLTASILLPLCLAVRCVYYPDPTDGGAVAGIIDAYKVTIPLATPTFLAGVIRCSQSSQLDSVRLVVTGGEKCPASIYAALGRHCGQAIILEGYGVTECSPIISVNHQDDPRPGTIGRLMGSLESAIVDPQTNRTVPTGSQGMLLVRGASVFEGYMAGPSESVETPFVEYAGLQWYRTGDLVVQDSDGFLTFAGRLKRFVKLGGEMISLPAIESVLSEQYGGDEGPVLAVLADGDDNGVEIVMFTTKPIDRQAANRTIRQGGLSGLHNIRRVIDLEMLPLLGTGKVDYRDLKSKLRTADGIDSN